MEIELEKKPPQKIENQQQILSQMQEKDLYQKMKDLEKKLEFLSIQEEYIKSEQQNLKRELIRSREEIKRIQAVPLVIGQFIEIIDENHGLVSSTASSVYYVRILSTLDR